MKASEIVSYFAAKSMGSVLLNVVDLIWEELDEIEKGLAKSLKERHVCTLAIKSRLAQNVLDEEYANTPYIALS